MPLKFLFAPLVASGHINACIGLGQRLMEKGHHVSFATSSGWIGKLEPLGFQEVPFQPEDQPKEKWGEIVASLAPKLALPPLPKLEQLQTVLYAEVISKTKEFDDALKAVVDMVKPDLIVVDDVAYRPGLMNQGVPWVLSASVNPIGITFENVPPAFTGIPAVHGTPEEWAIAHAKSREYFRELYEDFVKWVQSRGGPLMEWRGMPFFLPDSPYGNICMFPAELNYEDLRPDPTNWVRFDSFVREEPGDFELPTEFAALPGKTVYLSMGSIGCCELGLLKRLLGIIAKCPHKIIVSKGPLGSELDLADNMWGEEHLPQTKIIPISDVVISHGGNNTVTESFYFGKPLIILPLFCDQLDNATRIQETGLGMAFQPYEVTEKQLLEGIETILADDKLAKKMNAIGKRMRASNSQMKAADYLEDIAIKNRK